MKLLYTEDNVLVEEKSDSIGQVTELLVYNSEKHAVENRGIFVELKNISSRLVLKIKK